MDKHARNSDFCEIPFYCAPFDPLGTGEQPRKRKQLTRSKWATGKATDYAKRAAFWQTEATLAQEGQRKLLEQIEAVSREECRPDQRVQEQLKNLRFRRAEIAAGKIRPKRPSEIGELNAKISSLSDKLLPSQIRADTKHARVGNLKGEADQLAGRANDCFRRAAYFRKCEAYWVGVSEEPNQGDLAEIPELKFDAFTMEILFGLAERETGVVDVLSFRARQLLEPVLAAARMGNSDAATRLAEIAISTTEFINDLARLMPAVVRPAATSVHRWPIIKTKRSAKAPRDIDLFSEIELGSPPYLDENCARTNLDDPRGKIAIDLLCYLERVRKGFLFWNQKHGELRHSFTALEKEIGKLPAFEPPLGQPVAKEIVEAWWLIGKKVLSEKWPRPQKVTKLWEVVSINHREIPGKFKSQFIYEIKRRFYSLGGLLNFR